MTAEKPESPETTSSPDYSITRRVGYAHTLKTAPAFTFGRRNERVIADPGPGPGEYGPSMDFGRKGVGFGSSTRYLNPGAGTPSPLDYQPKTNQVMKSSSSFTFGTKSKPDHLKNKNPGPGTYEPGQGKDAVRPGRPAYSIQGRWNDSKEADKKPGPAEYSPDFKAREKEAPGVSLKFRHSSGGDGSQSPGPVYYPDRGYKGPPGKTFGTSRLNDKLDNGVPGPVYAPDKADDSVRRSRAAWSIGKSPRDARLDNGVPGPGTYLHGPVIDRPAGHSVGSDGRNAPAYTIPGKYTGMRPPAMPGPSDYNPKDSLRKSAPAFTFHGADQKDSRRNYPGPGAYEPGVGKDAVRPGRPAFSIQGRWHDSKEADKKPGPAEYSPDFRSREKEVPGASIKFRHGVDKPSDTPAPHDYADKDFRQIYMCSCKNKGYSFGLKPKPQTREAVPGPHYQIGCSTLGIAASEKVSKQKLSQTVVL